MCELSDGTVVFVALVQHPYTDGWPTVKIATSPAALQRKIVDVLLGEGRVRKAAKRKDKNAQFFVEQIRRGDPLADAIVTYCYATEYRASVDWIGPYPFALEETEELDKVRR